MQRADSASVAFGGAGPDVWMIRVLDWVGTRRYADFTWTVGGKLRRTARVWIYE